MIKKVPGRRGGVTRGRAAQTVQFTLSGEELRAVKDYLVAIYKELGLGYAAVSGDADVTLVIDVRIISLVVLYIRGLRESARVAKEAAVTAAQLSEQHLRARALVVLSTGLEKLRLQVVSDRLVVAAAQGIRWAELVEELQRDLADERLSRADRAALKSAAGEVLLQVEREQRQQKLRREELKGARVAAQAMVAEATQRRRQLQALLNLQGEDGYDPQMIDELMRIYEDQLRIPVEDPRKAAR